MIIHNLLLSSSISIDNSRIENIVEITYGAVLGNLDSVESSCMDYSIWDSTYNYVLGKKNDYPNIDIGEGVMSRLHLYSILVLKNDGQILLARKMVNGLETNITNQDELYNFFQKNSAALIQKRAGYSSKGLIIFPSGVGLYSSNPVLTGSGEGPVYGTILFARMIDSDLIEQINSQTNINATFYEYNKVLPDDVESVKSELLQRNMQGNAVVVKNINKETVAGYMLLRDTSGSPALILKVDDYRSIYSKSQKALIYILITLMAVGILLDIVLIWLMNTFIIKRLVKMEDKLSHISKDKATSERLEYSGDDEISSFAKSMNAALDSIAKISDERQALFHANPDTFFMVSPSGKIIDYKLNGIFNNIKVDAETNINDLFGADLSARISALISSSSRKDASADDADNDAPLSIEFAKELNGARKYIESRIISLNEEGYFMILRDITERKNIETVLLEKNVELERFNKFATDRELRMIELKKENELLKKHNESLKEQDTTGGAGS